MKMKGWKDGKKEFISCSECGHENYKSDFVGSSTNKCCRMYYKEVV
tara:strand:+ start:6678 stop:6815 length:138 start_codon:yes stop_codon:yes gene_type:complete